MEMTKIGNNKRGISINVICCLIIYKIVMYFIHVSIIELLCLVEGKNWKKENG